MPGLGTKMMVVSAMLTFTTILSTSLKYHRGLPLGNNLRSFWIGGRGISLFYPSFGEHADPAFSKVFGKRMVATTSQARPGSSVAKLAAQRAARELLTQ